MKRSSRSVRSFIAAHPSVHRSIRWYGSELADFLIDRPPFAEQPILSELARFEWTLAEVFDAADASAARARPPEDGPSGCLGRTQVRLPSLAAPPAIGVEHRQRYGRR